MSINVSCPSCGGRLSAPDNLAGKRVKCPKCSQSLFVPAGAERPAALHREKPAASAAPPPVIVEPVRLPPQRVEPEPPHAIPVFVPVPVRPSVPPAVPEPA